MKIYTESVSGEVAKGQEWRGSGGRVARLQPSVLVDCAMYKLGYTSAWESAKSYYVWNL